MYVNGVQLLILVLLVALFFIVVLKPSTEGYGNAIFKLDSRRPLGEQRMVCDYQYADCLRRASEGTYSENYCNWLHNMCTGAACMSPY